MNRTVATSKAVPAVTATTVRVAGATCCSSRGSEQAKVASGATATRAVSLNAAPATTTKDDSTKCVNKNCPCGATCQCGANCMCQ